MSDVTVKKVPELRFCGFIGSWSYDVLGNLFSYEQPNKYIVTSADYDNCYSIPVLTAGKSFILGYTDDSTGIKKSSHLNPVIIFDDFTTDSRYIDFSFKIKSSAIKLLSVAGNKNNLMFLFYVLKNLKYMPMTHSRHWISEFSKFEVLVPNQDEQEKIGTFFEQLDKLITLQQRKIDLLKKQKQGYLQKMFPKAGERVPELRFAGFSDDWKHDSLGNLVSISSGVSPSKFNQKEHKDTLFVKVNDLNNSFRTQNSSNLKVASSSKYKKIEKGSIIFPKRGAAIMTNKIRILSKDSYMDTNMMALKPIGIDEGYLYIFISKVGLFKIADTSTIPQINNKHIEPYDIILPKIVEQKKIGSFFKQIDENIQLQSKKLDSLKELKKGFLQKMFV